MRPVKWGEKSFSPIFLNKDEKTKCFKTPPRHPKSDLKSDPEPTKKIFGVNDMEKRFTPNPGGILGVNTNASFSPTKVTLPNTHTHKKKFWLRPGSRKPQQMDVLLYFGSAMFIEGSKM